MNTDNESIINGNILKALLFFFFPILLGTFFQQLYNTVDAVIVGNFVGKEALAAVGGGSSVFVNLLVGFFMGLSGGSGVIISQFYGAGDKRKISGAVHTGIALCIAGGIIMTLLGVTLCRKMMEIIKTPEEIIDSSVLYLRIYFLSLIPMFIYNMNSGVMRAVGDSKTPLKILVLGCFSNIVLDLFFVAFLKLGVAGVAIATGICQVECAAVSLWVLKTSSGAVKFSFREIAFTPEILREILRMGLPSGFQGALYTISNLIIQACINSFGTDTAAAWAAYGKIDSIFWMTIASLGISVTTFAGQNYGAGKIDRMKKGNWITLGLALVLTSVISVLYIRFGDGIYGFFTSDKNVILLGKRILMALVPFYLTFISIEVLSGTIHGAGVALPPTLITVFGVCVLRLVWLFFFFPKFGTLESVLAAYPITWTVSSVAFWIYYLSGLWLKKSGVKPE